ncbi:MAG TPA: prepilin-type N-terminal cleavage/methylation domain-containing protein [Desulfohalobiaceae bacterium]|nr:prepilin-type N-terminal cleavage/methylation domain-containing protein [Desulfohalobiaceae bacterium]
MESIVPKNKLGVFKEFSPTFLGFTLLELLVVLLIISVSLGLVFGFNYKQKASVQLKASGQELAHFLRMARSKALVQGQKNICYYNSSQHEFVDLLQNKKISLPSSISLNLASKDKPASGKIASFYPDGSAEAGKIELKSGQSTLNLKIDPLLGEISFNDDS